MSGIFISYSRRDRALVDSIARSLKDTGVDVWIDRENIRAGDTWRLQIVQAIDTCDAFVLMLSPNSAASDNVRREIDLALDAKRAVFVLMLETVTMPAEIRYQLAGLHYIDRQVLGHEKAVNRLIKDLKSHLAERKPSIEPVTRQVELVIQGIDPSSFNASQQAKLLAFVSKLSNVDRSQLKIANVAAGSLHVFVEMPAESAFQIKTLALNRDGRFRRMGIVSLRIKGDLKFINTALGILMSMATISFLETWYIRLQMQLSSMVGISAGGVQITLFVILASVIFLAVVTIAIIILLLSRVQPHQINQPIPTASTSAMEITPTMVRPTASPTVIVPTRTPITPSPETFRYHTEEFEKGLNDWTYFVKNAENNTIFKDPVEKVTLNTLDGTLSIDIRTTWRRIYSIYNAFEYKDVRLDASVVNLGSTNNYFSLVCRYSYEHGWYEFNITNGGLYDIKYAKPNKDGVVSYAVIADGGSNKIKSGQASNEYTAICSGETLIFLINGKLVKELKDTRLTSGNIGISAAAFENAPVKMKVDWIKISQP